MTDDEARELGLRAMLDQNSAAFGHIARLVHGYYAALVAAGFGPDAALLLARDWQAVLLRAGQNA